jgi:PmbA protein
MNNNLEIITGLIKAAKQKGATSADSISFSSNSISVATRLGKLENVERSESCGFGLRVMVGKKQAIVSGTDTSVEALNEMASRAVSMAQLAPEDKYIGLAEENILCNAPQNLDLYDGNEPSEEELLSIACKAENAALGVEGITNSEGGDASYGNNIIAIATSNGFAGEYKTSMSSISASVLAGEGTKMERDYDFSSTRHRADLESPEKIGKNAAEKALKRLNPRRVKTCSAPVIFDPRVAKSLISAFSAAINGASVAKGATFLKNSMGKNIFKDGINIINNPHIIRGLASKPYDAEGVANSKMSLVEDGVLQNWLLDIRSANQLGLQTNGCASRGIASPPSPSISNLYMENGLQSPQSLIENIKSGFYVTETFGMGVNTITGDYSQGASGFWIENGEISYSVSEITIAGSLSEMFMQLTPANDLEFRYGTNSPTLLIERMTIAGE